MNVLRNDFAGRTDNLRKPPDMIANTCADIHVTPDGRFVYASNRGDDSIAIFSVDPQSHELTAVGHQSTEPIPREFEAAYAPTSHTPLPWTV